MLRQQLSPAGKQRRCKFRRLFWRKLIRAEITLLLAALFLLLFLEIRFLLEIGLGLIFFACWELSIERSNVFLALEILGVMLLFIGLILN
ncbi:MAG TPA: hypothetical protein DDW76_36025 [Cyanobacteria bacterium UBA11369]|nr:hypothetical protein [Cyanobacteria bacterium UBA11371]HBE35876.1 hypothetical protein [Cyanobacteria bacterium UBA11368]HBE54017.1 hypothetical protein [Cyanobacteria bacterium UBA11369]